MTDTLLQRCLQSLAWYAATSEQHPDDVSSTLALCDEIRAAQDGGEVPVAWIQPKFLKSLHVELGDEYATVRNKPGAKFSAPLYARPLEARMLTIPPEIEAIIHNLHTQDNRITANPLFAVQQKRRIGGVDTEYCDNSEWVLDGEVVHLEPGEEPPEDARRVGYIDKWEFVTGCMTEQGCKDYIACNGHNLKEPRIYAYGAYRNAEFIAVRKWLMSLRPAIEKESPNA